ncbi:MAG: alpha/beta fold hydrolase [Actinomycetota bacterium]
MSNPEIPEPRYATATDGVSIAYQVFGHGRHDIVFLPGNATQLDVNWELPPVADFFMKLAALGRVILVDRRGVGLSDRVAPDALPPVEVLVSDLACVLDHVRSQDTVILGADEGAHSAVLFAATHPDRVRRLVLWAPRPSIVATTEHPWGGSRESWDEWLDWAGEHWGSRESIVNDLHELAPSWLEDERAIEYGAKIQRAAVSPKSAVALFRISMTLNMAEVLPAVHTPTLVLHRGDDGFVPPAAGRAVAELMPNATFVEFPGEDHFPYAGHTDEIFEHLRSFLQLDVSPVDRSRRLTAGVHTGEVETIDDKAGGLAVTVGARVGALAGPSVVLVSSTVKDLVAGSGLTFEDAGEHELKGVPDRWRLYRVVS